MSYIVLLAMQWNNQNELMHITICIVLVLFYFFKLKYLKNLDTQERCNNFWTMFFFYRGMCPKVADRMANSVNPDYCNVPKFSDSLIRICTVCHLSTCFGPIITLW